MNVVASATGGVAVYSLSITSIGSSNLYNALDEFNNVGITGLVISDLNLFEKCIASIAPLN